NGETVQPDRLGPAAVLAARREAGGGVLAAQIVDDLLLGRGGDAAPLEAVIRQDADVFGNARGVEGGRGLGLGGGRAQGGGERQNSDGRRDTHTGSPLEEFDDGTVV